MSLSNERRRACVAAVATALPERRVTNQELARQVDTTDEWIVSRTGIRERRLVEPGTGLSALAIPAARRCLEKAGVAAADLDGIIVATISGDQTMPAVANLVQHALGATKAWGYDLLNACNGFVAGLSTATCFIEAGRAQRILVIGGDVMSSIVDWKDRNTCVLFGDGAGAVLVEAARPASANGVVGFELHSDGSKGDELSLPCAGSVKPPEWARGHFIHQNGRAVFQNAVRRMTEVVDSLMGAYSLTKDDIDLLVPHQANLRIIEPIAERIGLPLDKVVINIDRLANTTAATIPLALADAEADGRLKAGTRVMLVAFGGGLTWGACYLRWGR